MSCVIEEGCVWFEVQRVWHIVLKSGTRMTSKVTSYSLYYLKYWCEIEWIELKYFFNVYYILDKKYWCLKVCLHAARNELLSAESFVSFLSGEKSSWENWITVLTSAHILWRYPLFHHVTSCALTGLWLSWWARHDICFTSNLLHV